MTTRTTLRSSHVHVDRHAESGVRTVRSVGMGAVLAVARHLGTGQRVALGSAHLEVPLERPAHDQACARQQLQAALASDSRRPCRCWSS